MALIKCKECGGQVSTKADSCPSCGAKLPRKTSLLTWIVLAIIAFTVVSWASANRTQKTPEQAAEEEARRAEREKQKEQMLLVAGAQSAVKARLKDPDSAEFGQTVYREPGIVCGYVNAKNSFGGYTGEKGFIVDIEGKSLMIQGEADGFTKAWNSRCAAK